MATRLAIFDLDGTLADTLADIAAAAEAVLARHGWPGHPLAAYRGFVGDGSRKLVERALPPAEAHRADAVLPEFLVEYRSRMFDKARPYPGVPELLDGLAARGLALAVLSNKPHAAAVAMVARLLPRSDWLDVRGLAEGAPRKPDPAGALELARRAGAAPGECVLVGDSVQDVATAVRAGMLAVAVAWGYQDPPRLRAAGAAAVLERPADLIDLLCDATGAGP
ncbi:MAG: HAD family hydrolase [Candidatus Krumholzibacteriota bacterium]|nr:HAD family hydrolase [Candidatus Krumholzibacteriota bacterium]